MLWVLPRSHLRVNTEQENARLLADPRVPLPGSVQTHLNAGDGVVYILPILHWGSNYSPKMRRTIHGGFSNYTHYETLCYSEYLAPDIQEKFQRWQARSTEMQHATESALRAAMENDAEGYVEALKTLHPERRSKGQMLSTVFLSKAACFIAAAHRHKLPDIPPELLSRGSTQHAITLNWGPQFAERFTHSEAALLWKRFQPLDSRLKSDEERYLPGFQSGPMRYFFNEMPTNYGLPDLIQTWGVS